MHVIAIHTIHDPDGFKKAGGAAFGKGVPSPFKLPIHGAANNHSKGICVWEGTETFGGCATAYENGKISALYVPIEEVVFSLSHIPL